MVSKKCQLYCCYFNIFLFLLLITLITYSVLHVKQDKRLYVLQKDDNLDTTTQPFVKMVTKSPLPLSLLPVITQPQEEHQDNLLPDMPPPNKEGNPAQSDINPAQSDVNPVKSDTKLSDVNPAQSDAKLSDIKPVFLDRTNDNIIFYDKVSDDIMPDYYDLSQANMAPQYEEHLDHTEIIMRDRLANIKRHCEKKVSSWQNIDSITSIVFFLSDNYFYCRITCETFDIMSKTTNFTIFNEGTSSEESELPLLLR